MTNTCTVVDSDATLLAVLFDLDMGSWQTCWICQAEFQGLINDCGSSDAQHVRARTGG